MANNMVFMGVDLKVADTPDAIDSLDLAMIAVVDGADSITVHSLVYRDMLSNNLVGAKSYNEHNDPNIDALDSFDKRVRTSPTIKVCNSVTSYHYSSPFLLGALL